MQSAIIIRKAESRDINRVLEIYDLARSFMRRSGNPHQWVNGYPSRATLEADIAEGNSFVIVNDGIVVATFYFRRGIEPTYLHIHEGLWLNDADYGVIHRAASDGSVKGIMHLALDFCFQLCPNIRIDTHRDNHVMQNALLRYGFAYCGIIHLANGDERLAYQKTSPWLTPETIPN